MVQTIVLKPQNESAKVARDVVGKIVLTWGMSDYIPRVVVSELVSNAIRHSGPDDLITVRAFLRNGVPRIEVQDESDEIPVMQTPAETDECGRGLVLLSYLVARWGVWPLDKGKIVYAELRDDR